VERQEPGFLHYAIVDETFLRLTSTQTFHRSAPVYFYLVTLAWALGIWGVVLAALSPTLRRLWRARERDGRVAAFAVRGTVALVVFFTLSASKRPHYILPAIVPLALLVAIAIGADRARAMAVLRAVAYAAGIFGAGTLIARFGGVHAHGDFTAFSQGVMTASGVVFLGWAATTWWLGRTPVRAVACAALLTPVLALALQRPFTQYAEERSARTLARHLGDAPVVAFETFRPSLPFYLGRPVPLVGHSARALTSNYLKTKPMEALYPSLMSLDMLRVLMAGDHPPLVIAKKAGLPALRKLSGRKLDTVYSDHMSVVVRPGT
jgi:4-amino-4-deoxy-L-arabinose transferase-like glycosyltransferase